MMAIRKRRPGAEAASPRHADAGMGMNAGVGTGGAAFAGIGRRWRAVLSALGLLVVSVFLLSGCTGIPAGVSPVKGFEADRYLGKWYAIARLDHRFERGLSHVSASYAARPDGRIEVYNRGFDARRCVWRDITGSARFLAGRDVASLAVRFAGPFEGGYHVIDLDAQYRWAVVSGPTRDYLWILARSPRLEDDLLRRLVERARGLGYPVDELIMVDHTTPQC